MDGGTRALGIASAVVLVATLLWQLRAEWRKGTSEGVSCFLFVGQLAASTGFAIYSALIADAVFVATNVATGAAAIAGLAITLFLRRRAWRGRSPGRGAATSGHATRRVAPWRHARTEASPPRTRLAVDRGAPAPLRWPEVGTRWRRARR